MVDLARVPKWKQDQTVGALALIRYFDNDIPILYKTPRLFIAEYVVAYSKLLTNNAGSFIFSFKSMCLGPTFRDVCNVPRIKWEEQIC